MAKSIYVYTIWYNQESSKWWMISSTVIDGHQLNYRRWTMLSHNICLFFLFPIKLETKLFSIYQFRQRTDICSVDVEPLHYNELPGHSSFARILQEKHSYLEILYKPNENRENVEAFNILYHL